MKKLLFLFIYMPYFLWIGRGEAHAQDQHLIDSLRNVLQIQKEDTGKVKILITLGYQYNALGDFKTALHFINAALTLADKLNNQIGKAKAYMALGSVYRLSVSESEGLVYYYKALKLIDKLGDKRLLSDCYKYIGFSNYWQGNYSESYNAYHICLKLSRETNYAEGIIESLTYLVNEFYDKNDYDSVLKTYSEVLAISENSGNNRGIGYANSGYALYWTKQSENAQISDNQILKNECLKKSIKYNELAAKNFEDVRDFGATGDCYNRIADINIRLSMFSQAAKYLEKALENAEKTGYDDNFKNAYKSFSDLHSAQGNFKQAYKNFKMYIVYRDKISNLENTKKAFQAKAQYDTEKKEQQIALLTKETKLQQAELQKQNTTRNIMIAACVLIALLAGIIYNRYLIKQNANSEIENTLHHLKTTQGQLVEHEKLATLGKFTAEVAQEMELPVNEIKQLSRLNKRFILNLKNNNSSNDAEALKNNLEHIFNFGKEADDVVKKVLIETRRIQS